MNFIKSFLLVAVVAGCANTTVTPLSQNQFLLSTSAAPACGRSGAAKVAAKMAAVETIRHGYERFVVLNASSVSNVRAVSTGPTYANTTSNFSPGFGNGIYGNSNTTYGGGGIIYTGSNNADLNVLLLGPKDKGYSNGLVAKVILGTDWPTLVEEGINTCGD